MAPFVWRVLATLGFSAMRTKHSSVGPISALCWQHPRLRCCLTILERTATPPTSAGCSYQLRTTNFPFAAMCPACYCKLKYRGGADPNRCDRGYVGNTIGQANAVSDKVLDLRQCKYPGANLSAKVLSGALMSNADFTGTNLQVRLLRANSPDFARLRSGCYLIRPCNLVFP
jgi:hypothetical protein